MRPVIPKILFILLVFKLCLLSAFGQNQAQGDRVIGPISVYVSTQNPNDETIGSGISPAYADEGRVININVSNIVGPIEVSPKNFPLTGPACPTYTANGQRVPANPLPSNTIIFSGSVVVKAANKPAAGTMANASFKIKDDGYWTKCSANQKNYYPDGVIVQYNIYSLKLELDEHNLKLCKDDEKQVNITTQFPNTGGTVTWASKNGKVSITQNATGALIKGISKGDDEVSATLTVNGVTYVDKIVVKVREVKFKAEEKSALWVARGTFDCKTNLADGIDPNDIEWSVDNTGAPAACTIDANTGIVTFGVKGGAEYIVKAKSKAVPTCEKTFALYVCGFKVEVKSVNPHCDGDEADLEVVPVPEDGDAAVLNGLNFTLASATTVASGGNPGGTVVLAFTAMGADRKCKVRNCRWYSTQANHCNVTSDYNITATANSGGQVLRSESPGVLSVTTAFGTCLDGTANITNSFTGVPNLRIRQLATGVWDVTVVQAAFRRDVQATVTVTAPANSQYRTMIVNEENYHKGQFEGRNGRLIADCFDPALIMAGVNAANYRSVVRQTAIDNATRAFWAQVDAEDTRSYALVRARRCQIEVEAKNAIRASHRGTMPCAYPACP